MRGARSEAVAERQAWLFRVETELANQLVGQARPPPAVLDGAVLPALLRRLRPALAVVGQRTAFERWSGIDAGSDGRTALVPAAEVAQTHVCVFR